MILSELEAKLARGGEPVATPRKILIVPASAEVSAEAAAFHIAEHLQHEIGAPVLLLNGQIPYPEEGPPVEDGPLAVNGLATLAENPQIDVEDLLIVDPVNGWHRMEAGRSRGRLSQRLIRTAFSRLMEQAGHRFEFVLIYTLDPDHCPVAKALAGVVDAATICVEDRKTMASSMKNACEVLQNNGATRISIVLDKRPPQWLVSAYDWLQGKLPFKIPFPF